MTIKSILLPLSEPAEVKAACKVAFTVAKKFVAHVEAVHVRPDPRLIAADYVGDSMSGPMIEQLMKTTETRSAETARKTRRAFDDACADAQVRTAAKPPARAGNAVTATWREEVGYEDQWLRTYGRVADLIVLTRPAADTDIGARLSLEAALMETGRPLLVVPPKPAARIGNHVAIAWNGSTEASRAVSEARPFLDAAKTVTVLTANEPGSESFNPEGLLDYLAWRGLRAKQQKVRTRGDIGKALLAAAENSGADLLVMGAYTHSRVREMILGGVTRHVLGSTNIPVLMAH